MAPFGSGSVSVKIDYGLAVSPYPCVFHNGEFAQVAEKPELDMKGKYPISLASSAHAVVANLGTGHMNKEQQTLAVEVISDLLRQNKTLRQSAVGNLNKELEKTIEQLTQRLRDCDSYAAIVVDQVFKALGRTRDSNFTYKDSASEVRERSKCAPYIAVEICKEAMPALKAARERIEDVCGLNDLRRLVMGEDEPVTCTEYRTESTT